MIIIEIHADNLFESYIHYLLHLLPGTFSLIPYENFILPFQGGSMVHIGIAFPGDVCIVGLLIFFHQVHYEVSPEDYPY